MDFESQIAQQAQAELQFEIDQEAVYMIKAMVERKFSDARMNMPVAHEFKWVDEELDTISYSQKAEGFARKIAQAKMAVYKTTNRFMPNWIENF